MPESYYKPGREVAAWTLRKAHDAGQVVKISCSHCHIRRFYKPAEMREVAGNLSADQMRHKVRCEKCRKKDYMDVEFVRLTGQEAQDVRFRRLVEIRWERRVIWRDEG